MASSVGQTLLFLIAMCGAARAQSWLVPVENFAPAESALHLQRHAEPEKPFTVAGECGAFMGQQDGQFEAWLFPVKVLSHMHVEAQVEGYDVPIDVNAHAAEIDVQPDHTTITYAHIAFTLRETFFAMQCAPQDPNKASTGAMVLFTVDSIRPTTLTFSFTPEVKPMWPASQLGQTNAEWVPLNPHAPNALTELGWYMLHTDWPELSAAVAMPGTLPGILPPYQERPKFYPTQLILHYDPRTDRGKAYPLLMAMGRTREAASHASLEAALREQNAQALTLYQQTSDYYTRFFDTRMTVDTPDTAFNEDFRWAAISIDQLRVRHGNETGLVAGFYSSGDSARPGFGWFFGRDSLYTIYAIDGYGDFALTRTELEFLMARQRSDGKMPHEYSQTADSVDWASTPYEYAAADSTPLFLMAMEDYVDASGDTAFLEKSWPVLEKAWEFERTHDTDGDGIYDNSQGTGWVESWIPKMPHQEIYLALLDEQASGAMARMSRSVQKTDIASQAEERATRIAAKIPQEYTQQKGMYAFSYNGTEGVDNTATIYPAVTWWNGRASLPQTDEMFARWASDEFSTDWGTRDVGNHEAIYDPISYHQGSVWPLFTGWTAVAEYRTGHTLSGYAHLMQTANLTTAQDLGAVTELLSGDFFTPFGRSTTHQLWSSAMVMIPALRGMFGLSLDAAAHAITIDPRLPAQWGHAALHNLHLGDQLIDLRFERSAAGWQVRAQAQDGKPVTLKSTAAGAKTLAGGALEIPTPGVEVGMDYGADAALPLPGARTAMLKVLRQEPGARSLTLLLEAQGNSTQTLFLRQRERRDRLHVEGGTVAADGKLGVHFPGGNGYVRQQVTLRW
ncbi:MAG: amylo-alpha-1,6-glucosidase [Acidobacteriaceae bacterium]